MATDAAPRFAVVMRTYQWDPFIRRQMQRYQCVAAGGDLFVSADETHGPLGDFDGLPALRTTNAQLVALGLADRFEKGSLIWWNGDYPSYAFLHAYPNYDYYVFVEYDSLVRVPLARVVQEVAEAGVDFVAAPIPGPLNKWFWWPYVRAVYDPAELRATLNCICILSRRSLRLLFDRRVDMGRDPSLARWPISEAFVATELARAGHVFAPLSRFGDDSAYDWFPPLLEADLDSCPAAFIHPVLDEPRYIGSLLRQGKRVRDYFNPRSQLRRRLARCAPELYRPHLRKAAWARFLENRK